MQHIIKDFFKMGNFLLKFKFLLFLLLVFFINQLDAQNNNNVYDILAKTSIRVPVDTPIENNGAIAKIFETPKYKILLQLFQTRAKEDSWLYAEKLSLLRDNEYAAAMLKYSPGAKARGQIKILNNELWLPVFSHDSKLLILYIDDGFDGFVYEGNQSTNGESRDGESRDGDLIDRIGFVYPALIKNKKLAGNIQLLNLVKKKPNEIEFTIPYPNKPQTHTLTLMKYKKIFCDTIKNLEKNKTPFVPFENTEVRICNQ